MHILIVTNIKDIKFKVYNYLEDIFKLIKTIKNFFIKNYQIVFCFTILIAIFVVAINPKPYIDSTLKGFIVWAKIVLPSLFAFFIFTKILMQNNKTMNIFSFLNKPFKKIYSCEFGGYIFIMSVLAGYPVGASLISEFYEQNKLDLRQSKILCAFTSTSGPMFILGSVATSMVFNKTIGLVILISHLFASLTNGLLYKKIINKKYKYTNTNENKKIINFNKTIKKQNFNDIMLNTITSCLMIGGSIALCFTLVEILFGIVSPISDFLPNNNTFSNIGQVLKGIIAGIVEITNGCLQISNCGLNPLICSTIICGLISFGGLSIHLQSVVFLSKCKIKYSYFLATKITHMIFSILLSLVFGAILL